MTKTLEALFDGEVFRPKDKIDLVPNKNYTLIIRDKDEKPDSLNAWDILDKLTGAVEAPQDWAFEHDHYLYGVPRKSKRELE
jgi:hypothetical protein